MNHPGKILSESEIPSPGDSNEIDIIESYSATDHSEEQKMISPNEVGIYALEQLKI
jgi:hypothetical protein